MEADWLQYLERGPFRLRAGDEIKKRFAKCRALLEYRRIVTFGPIFYYSYPTGLIDRSGSLLPDATAMLPP